MHLDPIMPTLVATAFAILGIGMIMRWFKQPYVIAYLVVGIILGPHILGLITDQDILNRLGSIGVVMLLFFVGMEISPQQLRANWVIPTVGALFQVLFTFLALYLLGWVFGWRLEHIILFSFVFALSSTAVVLKLLEDWNELHSRIGRHVLGILIIQDLAVIPMLIGIGLLAGDTPSTHTLILQILGGIFIISTIVLLMTKKELRLPLPNWLIKDHEMQVFSALFICFGLALITGLLELSSALGAFIGGMIVSATKQTQWIHHSLHSIRTIFIALFFVSVGMLIDLQFIYFYWVQVLLIVLIVFLLNTFINAFILRGLRESWKNSFYGAAMLSQLGEFGFVLSSVGYHLEIISTLMYQLIIAVIALTLLLSPAWIALVKKVTGYEEVAPFKN